MYIDDTVQLNVILMSVGLGALLAFIFDVFTVVNRFTLKSDNVVIFNDILYCLVSALVCFLFLLVVNNGRMRTYFLPGAVAGFCCWHFSFSAMFLKLLYSILIRIGGLFRLLGKIFALPFRPINALATVIYNKTYKLFKKYFANLKNKLKIDLKKI